MVSQEANDIYMRYKKSIEEKILRHPHDIFIFENPVHGLDEFDFYPLINTACPPQFKPKMKVITSPYSK